MSTLYRLGKRGIFTVGGTDRLGWVGHDLEGSVGLVFDESGETGTIIVRKAAGEEAQHPHCLVTRRVTFERHDANYEHLTLQPYDVPNGVWTVHGVWVDGLLRNNQKVKLVGCFLRVYTGQDGVPVAADFIQQVRVLTWWENILATFGMYRYFAS